MKYREGYEQFLYSQDLSNCTTELLLKNTDIMFLYSQDLSNCTTFHIQPEKKSGFCTLKI